MLKIKFVEAREVLDGDGVVIQRFKVGQVVELSNASARHWLNRGAALDVRAEAQAAREAVKAAEATDEDVLTEEVKADPPPVLRKRGRPKLSSA